MPARLSRTTAGPTPDRGGILDGLQGGTPVEASASRRFDRTDVAGMASNRWLVSFDRCHPATAGQRQLDRLLASNPFRFALGFARCRIAKAPEVDPASVVWPAGDLGLPQRGPAVLMRLIDAYHPAELAVGALDALGPGAPCPDLLASDQLGEPHDLTAPTLAVMAGRLATLKQQLVGHLVEQGVVVGEQRSVVLGHVECDGEASAIGAGV